MQKDQRFVSVGSQFRLVCVLLVAISVRQGFVADANWYWLTAFSALALLVSLVSTYRRRTTAKEPLKIQTWPKKPGTIDSGHPAELLTSRSVISTPTQRAHLRDKLLR